MRKFLAIIILFLGWGTVKGAVNFDQYFNEGVFRFDCYLTGNSTVTTVLPAAMKFEPVWGGSRTNLADAQH